MSTVAQHFSLCTTVAKIHPSLAERLGVMEVTHVISAATFLATTTNTFGVIPHLNLLTLVLILKVSGILKVKNYNL